LYNCGGRISNLGDALTCAFSEVTNIDRIKVNKNHTLDALEYHEINHEQYELLDYIKSTGTQYIDTNYYWTSEKATIIADLEVTKWKASSTIFGSEEGYTNPYVSNKRYFAHILHAGSANGNYANYIGTGSTGNTTTLAKDTRYIVKYIAHGDNTFSTIITTNN
jgi:hypothetical protein